MVSDKRDSISAFSSSRVLAEVDASVAMAWNLGEIRRGVLKRLLGLIAVALIEEEAAAVMVVTEEQWKGRRAAGKEWESGVAPARKVDRRSKNWSFDAKSIESVNSDSIISVVVSVGESFGREKAAFYHCRETPSFSALRN